MWVCREDTREADSRRFSRDDVLIMGACLDRLIPLNPIEGSKWTASAPEDEREFVRRLEAKGIPTTVRDTRGREIDAACGQLAATEG